MSASPPASWRTAFLVEHRRTPEEFAYVRAIPNYDAVRTTQYSYVEYETGEKELYDLTVDPQELTRASTRVPLRSSCPTSRGGYALKSCAGAGCKVTEDGG